MLQKHQRKATKKKKEGGLNVEEKHFWKFKKALHSSQYCSVGYKILVDNSFHFHQQLWIKNILFWVNIYRVFLREITFFPDEDGRFFLFIENIFLLRYNINKNFIFVWRMVCRIFYCINFKKISFLDEYKSFYSCGNTNKYTYIYIYIYIYSNCHEIRHLNVESMFKKEIPRKSSFISHFNLKYT